MKVTPPTEGKITRLLSVVSVAVKVAVPAVTDFTVKVATPLALELTVAGEIVSVPPRLDVRDTVFPETALLLESTKVTVIVEVVDPSAVIELGEALTVEPEALTAPTLTAIELAVHAVVKEV